MWRLRIEPGALRTALSRLAADQWVIRERAAATASIHSTAMEEMPSTWRRGVSTPARRQRGTASGRWPPPPDEAREGPPCRLPSRLRRDRHRELAAARNGPSRRRPMMRSGMLVFRQRPILAPETLAGFWELAGRRRPTRLSGGGDPLSSLLEKGAASAGCDRGAHAAHPRMAAYRAPRSGTARGTVAAGLARRNRSRIACDIYAKLAGLARNGSIRPVFLPSQTRASLQAVSASNRKG